MVHALRSLTTKDLGNLVVGESSAEIEIDSGVGQCFAESHDECELTIVEIVAMLDERAFQIIAGGGAEIRIGHRLLRQTSQKIDSNFVGALTAVLHGSDLNLSARPQAARGMEQLYMADDRDKLDLTRKPATRKGTYSNSSIDIIRRNLDGHQGRRSDMATSLDSHPFRVQARLDPKPWGGQQLAEFGFPLPTDDRIGEAVITAPDATVLDGPHPGMTLRERVSGRPIEMIGRRGLAATNGKELFPLLVKLIDAQETLSIQVHPNDDDAPSGHLGKTEAYHVLRAEPGSVIALGLEQGVPEVEFAAACRTGDGATNHLLRWLPAVIDETILIPAGTVHALGGGCVVYEVQQQSDITYRFDDGGRRDINGERRPLHVDAGLAALKFASRPDPITPVPLSTGNCSRTLLTACRYLALEKVELLATARAVFASSDGPNVVTLLSGTVQIEVAGTEIMLNAGETAIVPAAAKRFTLLGQPSATLLRAWIPDLLSDVVETGRAAGAPVDRIIALAGALPDLRRLVPNYQGSAST